MSALSTQHSAPGTSLRQWAAQRLREMADRLSPPVRAVPAAEPIVPLDFIPTNELAEEIRRRNDLSLVFWGRRRAVRVVEEGCRVEGEFALIFGLTAVEAMPVLNSIADRVQQHMQELGNGE